MKKIYKLTIILIAVMLSNSLMAHWATTGTTLIKPESSPMPLVGCTNPSWGGTIATDQASCSGFDPAEITNTALPTGWDPGTSGTVLEYKWQKSTTNNTSGFSDISGANSTNYDPPAITVTTWYKRLSKMGCSSVWGSNAESNVVEMTVAAFQVGTISANQSVCYNSNPAELTGITPTGGSTPYTYQWQSSINNSNYTDITGANSLDYQPGTLTTTTYYRLNQTSSGGCGSSNTNTVTVAVYPNFVVGSIAADQNICYNTTPNELFGSAPAGGNTPYTYQWQSSTDNTNFSDISGATSLDYQPGNLTVTTYYKQVQTSASSCGDLNTNTVTITVYPNFAVGSITANQTICHNTVPNELTGIAPQGGKGSSQYTYQWQSSINNYTYVDIPGANSLNYQPDALTRTTFFRQTQTSPNGCGSINTNTVTITVYSFFSVGSITSNHSICAYTHPNELFGIAPAGGNTPYTYQWQSSGDNTNFSDISGATSLNYQPGPIMSTTYYRQTQSSANGCGDLNTNTVTITVYPEFAVGSINADQIICHNTAPNDLTGNPPAGGNTPYTYQWQSSTDNTNFSDISGATSINYQPGSILSTTYYRQIQSSASGCGDLNTNTVTITVYPEFVVGSINADQTICHNTVPNELTGVAPQGGKGSSSYTYQWQSSINNFTYVDIPGATSLNYQPDALTVTTFFRQTQTSSNGCGSINTNTVTITVQALPTADAGSDDNLILSQTDTYTLSGSATNQQSALWTTSGDGTFNDATLLAADYTVGSNDISVASVVLTLTSHPVSPCSVSVNDDMTLSIESTPANQASDIVVSNILPTQMDINWTNGSGAKRAVFINEVVPSRSQTADPQNGITYTPSIVYGQGDQIETSGWYCIYNGSGSSASVTGLTPNTNYKFMVCEYNGSAGSEFYNVSTETNNPNQVSSVPVSDWAIYIVVFLIGSFIVVHYRRMLA